MSIPPEFWTTIEGLKDTQATQKDKLELLNKLVEFSEKIPTFNDTAQIERFIRRYVIARVHFTVPVGVSVLLIDRTPLIASVYILCTRPKRCVLHLCVCFGTTCVIQRS